MGNTLIARLLKGGCRPGRAHLETLSRPADQTEVLHLRQRQPQTAASHNQTSSLSSCSSFFCSFSCSSYSCSFCSSFCCSCSALQRPHRAPSVQAAAPQMRFAPLLSPVAANYCHPKPKISVYIKFLRDERSMSGTICLDCVHTIPSSTISCFFQGSPQFLQIFGRGPVLEISLGPPTAERKKMHKPHKSSNILVPQPWLPRLAISVLNFGLRTTKVALTIIF